jgi:hypothetical protein
MNYFIIINLIYFKFLIFMAINKIIYFIQDKEISIIK